MTLRNMAKNLNFFRTICYFAAARQYQKKTVGRFLLKNMWQYMLYYYRFFLYVTDTFKSTSRPL